MLVELKGALELVGDLPHAVDELQKHRRALLRKHTIAYVINTQYIEEEKLVMIKH